jgi:hypothetical protein
MDKNSKFIKNLNKITNPVFKQIKKSGISAQTSIYDATIAL